MSIIPETEKRLVPWPLRIILWIVIVLFCALIGSIAGHFLSPLWKEVTIQANTLPLLADAVEIIQPGPAFISAVVGIVVSHILSKIYQGLRRVGRD